MGSCTFSLSRVNDSKLFHDVNAQFCTFEAYFHIPERESHQAWRIVPVESYISQNHSNAVTFKISNEDDLFYEAIGGVAC